ncbi:hypothetical protein QUB60_23960 [Microcoleus sp. A2-C5]|uniref:hypothetical protein n=1 Tax=unclassified Microcoleus TaxID=2642155 RepID=UPI002FD6BE93
MNLPYTQINCKAAEIKARQIELDMASNNFDATLAKYKPEKQANLAVTELFVGVSRGEAIASVPTNSVISALKLLLSTQQQRTIFLSFSETNLFLMFPKRWQKSFGDG